MISQSSIRALAFGYGGVSSIVSILTIITFYQLMQNDDETVHKIGKYYTIVFGLSLASDISLLIGLWKRSEALVKNHLECITVMFGGVMILLSCISISSTSSLAEDCKDILCVLPILSILLIVAGVVTTSVIFAARWWIVKEVLNTIKQDAASLKKGE